MRRTCIAAAVAAAGLVLDGGSASGETIDFEGLPASEVVSGTPPANTVLTDDFSNLGVVFGRAGVSAGVSVNSAVNSTGPSSGVNVVVALDAAGQVPASATGDMYFYFVAPGTSDAAATDLVSFTIGDAGGDLDSFILHAYDLSDTEVVTLPAAGTARFGATLSNPEIHRVHIEFLSDPAGYGLDDLTFNTPGGQTAVVPLPLAAWGAGALMVGMGVRRPRKFRGD